MLGVILCGGQSQRMGSDKGLLKLEAKTWAQTAIDKFLALNIPVKVSVNEKQLTQYAEMFENKKLIIDNTSLPIKGPVLGLLSCHLAHLNEDLFVLACDLPLMEEKLLKILHDVYQSTRGFDAYLFTNNDEAEPLCAIYTSDALAHVYQLLINGQLTKFSMKFMLENLNIFTISLKEEEKKCFRNFNAHAELNGL